MRTAILSGLTLFLATTVSCVCAYAQTPVTQPSSRNPSNDLIGLAASSSNLTTAEVQALRDKVKANADDMQSRARLLGFYFLKQNLHPKYIAARRQQILWMIRNHPGSRLAGSPFCSIVPMSDAGGYLAAKALWTKLLQKPSPPTETVENAATFFTYVDPASAEAILKRAAAADPNNPLWHKNLAEIYSRAMPTTVPAGEYARRSLEEMEKAFVLTKTPEKKFYILTDLPAAAMACGDKAKTTHYAKLLLTDAQNFKMDWNYGNAILKGNLALGRVALASGDTKTANARLLDAGKTPGSPQLDSFGPNMELAKELLAKGQKETVLQYLDLCGKFWKMDNGRLNAWRNNIKAGQIPDFGANLVY